MTKEELDFMLGKLVNGENLSEKERGIAFSAIHRLIPYKPKEYEDKFYACKCGNCVMMKWEKYPDAHTPKSAGLPYCLICGQRLDWSEEDEANEID